MRKLFFFLAILTLSSSAALPVQAQFWKKIFGSKEDRHQTKDDEERAEEDRPSRKEPSLIFRYPESEKKDRYRIDLLLPLHLDEMVEGDRPQFRGRVPEKISSAMEFYQGAKIAADSLGSMGLSLDIHVQDIASGNTPPHALIESAGLDTSALIVGFVQSTHIDPLARFSRERNINFVSALSPSDAGVIENPFFTLIQPTLKTHCEELAARMKRSHRKLSPILYYRTSRPVDKEAQRYLTGALPHSTRRVQVNQMPAIQELEPLLDPQSVNVMVMGIMDPSYAESLMRQLSDSFPDYDFEVYGMPSWKGMNSLKQANAYPNLAINMTSPFHYDTSTPLAIEIARKYQDQFGGIPSEFVFRGYELVFWFGQLLNKYGSVYNSQVQDKQESPITGFDLRLNKDDLGKPIYVENKKLYLFRYQGSTYTVN